MDKKKTSFLKTKFIFITGGVASSLGKGLAAASIGALMEARGLSITIQKMDPYINVDPGTMNPFQHGEVFVTDDGAETDLDLGHYERFTSAVLGKKNNFTTGQVYDAVISKERRGGYLGGTVQVIPHITDEIKRRILAVAENVDIAIIEVGGTVGDIESLPFLEAIRQLKGVLGKQNVLYIHLTLVPYIKAAGELKTKPTQHSVQKLREIGIQPDILLCRCDRPLSKDIKDKIALFANVEEDAVITAMDVESIYQVPLLFHQENLDERITELLNIWSPKPKLKVWEDMLSKIKTPMASTTVGVVGKYVELKESYKSLNEALIHGGIANNCKVNIEYIDSEKIEKEGIERYLNGVDSILVPGGFGVRGIEGKIKAIQHARINKIPYFGICLGMQLAVIEYSRNVCGISDATSSEFDEKCKNPIIHLMEGQDLRNLGATMRLGAYPCGLKDGSLAFKAYKAKEISERHRHRYEVNNSFIPVLTKNGLIFSGQSPDKKFVEIVELADNPWFLGCQFHPEFKSKPISPHPLFKAFIEASLKYKNKKGKVEGSRNKRSHN